MASRWLPKFGPCGTPYLLGRIRALRRSSKFVPLHPHCCGNTVSFRLSLDPNTHTHTRTSSLSLPRGLPLVKSTVSSQSKSVSSRPVSRTLAKARQCVPASFPRLQLALDHLIHQGPINSPLRIVTFSLKTSALSNEKTPTGKFENNQIQAKW